VDFGRKINYVIIGFANPITESPHEVYIHDYRRGARPYIAAVTQLQRRLLVGTSPLHGTFAVYLALFGHGKTHTNVAE